MCAMGDYMRKLAESQEQRRQETIRKSQAKAREILDVQLAGLLNELRLKYRDAESISAESPDERIAKSLSAYGYFTSFRWFEVPRKNKDETFEIGLAVGAGLQNIDFAPLILTFLFLVNPSGVEDRQHEFQQECEGVDLVNWC